jgi:GAF domain-containing protein
MNQGLCGSAAFIRRLAVADNVADDPRYIQASDLVKSQISVPVLADGMPVAVFNVESYFLATFKNAIERDFVETCARIVGKYLARTMARDLVRV